MCLCENIFCCSRWKLLEKERISGTSFVLDFFCPANLFISVSTGMGFFVKAISCTVSENMCLFVSCIWLFGVLMLEWTHDNKESLTFLSAFAMLLTQQYMLLFPSCSPSGFCNHEFKAKETIIVMLFKLVPTRGNLRSRCSVAWLLSLAEDTVNGRSERCCTWSEGRGSKVMGWAYPGFDIQTVWGGCPWLPKNSQICKRLVNLLWHPRPNHLCHSQPRSALLQDHTQPCTLSQCSGLCPAAPQGEWHLC